MTRVGSSRHSTDAVVEALCDPHFRKQRNFGPSKADLRQKVGMALDQREPVELVALMFTRKNVNPLKRGPGDESTIDLAEIVSLIHLNSFAKLIAKLHPFGARLTILSEGKRFLRAFQLREDCVRLYQERMRGWIDRLQLSHVRFLDYEDFLESTLSPSDKRLREQSYVKAHALYRELIGQHLQPADMSSTLRHVIAVDPVKDPGNARNNFVPLWDSIKHSIPYVSLTQEAQARNVPFETLYRQVFSSLMHVHADVRLEELRNQILRQSWDAAIEHNARIKGDADAGIDVAALVSPAAIRTTINPRPQSAFLGIHSVRETISRVQPWHGTAYLKLDGKGCITATVLTKLELESMGATPVRVHAEDGDICFYASPDAAALIAQPATPTFNMSTKR